MSAARSDGDAWLRGHAQIPAWAAVDPRLSAGEVATLVYVVLRLFGDSYALSQAEIAEDLGGVHEDTIGRHVRKLVSLGYLASESRIGAPARLSRGPAFQEPPAEVLEHRAAIQNLRHQRRRSRPQPPIPTPEVAPETPGTSAGGTPVRPTFMPEGSGTSAGGGPILMPEGSGTSAGDQQTKRADEEQTKRADDARARATVAGGGTSLELRSPAPPARQSKSTKSSKAAALAAKKISDTNRIADLAKRYPESLVADVMAVSDDGASAWRPVLERLEKVPAEIATEALRAHELACAKSPKGAPYVMGIAKRMQSERAGQQKRLDLNGVRPPRSRDDVDTKHFTNRRELPR